MKELNVEETPINPFEISNHEFSLREICEERERLFKKVKSNKLTNTDDILLLYRLRVSELLHLLQDSEVHLDLLMSENRMKGKE